VKRKITYRNDDKSQKPEEIKRETENRAKKKPVEKLEVKTEQSTLNTSQSYPPFPPMPPLPPMPPVPPPPQPGPVPPPVPEMRLARAYVPYQTYGRTFDPAEGLLKGTIFPELFMPYDPKKYREV
jgi:hypothetical protein